jgi:hypothetical protein
MMKRICWGALVAAALIVASMAAKQFSATIWRKVMHEDPPVETV